MTERIKKVNSLIRQTFAEILQREADLPADVLVTVSTVETTPNLRGTHVWLYITPEERAEETLEQLTPQLYDLQGSLNRALSMRPLPRVFLHIDHGAEYSQQIDRHLAGLKKPD